MKPGIDEWAFDLIQCQAEADAITNHMIGHGPEWSAYVAGVMVAQAEKWIGLGDSEVARERLRSAERHLADMHQSIGEEHC
jgi:hypothetical protein